MPQASSEPAWSTYRTAQRALADLKAAVRETLARAPDDGLTNAQIGRLLGIYAGHEGHEGHISRTLLGMLKKEGVAWQDSDTLRWRLVDHLAGARNADGAAEDQETE